MEKKDTLELDEEEKKDLLGKEWGKLTSVNPKIIGNEFCRADSIEMGRGATNTIIIPDKRLSTNHCKLINKNGKYFIEDLSTNGTFLNEEKVGKGNIKEFKNGDIICLLHKSKVPIEDVIAFVFSVINDDTTNTQKKGSPLKRKNVEDDNENIELKKEIEKKKKLDDDLGESMKCSICIDYIYQCVTLIDCLHNFCGACYSDWMKKSKDCPECRKPVIAVKKNAQVNSLITQYLDGHPDKKRSQEEYDQMNKTNKITIDIIQFNDNKKAGATKATRGRTSARRGRGSAVVVSTNNGESSSDLSYDSDDNNNSSSVNTSSASSGILNAAPIRSTQCRECLSKRGGDGFQCPAGNQKHLMCINCRELFPDRGLSHKQKCTICDQAFCNIYWNCKGRGVNKLHELKNYTVPTSITKECFRGNAFEAEELNKYLKYKKLTTTSLFDHMMKNYISKSQFKYKINKKIIPNPVAVPLEITLSEDSPVCSSCFALVWFQLIFFYRIEINRDLPASVKDRPVCWYGINCRTMDHNSDHARKLSHACEQSKF